MEFFFSFTDTKAADGKALEGHRCHGVDAPSAQVFEQAALNDAEHQLAPGAAGAKTAFGPTNRPRGGRVNIIASRIMRNTFIERHRDIATERLLNFHHYLRCKQMRRTIEVRLKMHARVRNLSHPCQAKNLISTAVGQERAVPAHEAVQ